MHVELVNFSTTAKISEAMQSTAKRKKTLGEQGIKLNTISPFRNKFQDAIAFKIMSCVYALCVYNNIM